MTLDAWSALRGLELRPLADGGLINTTYVAGEPVRWVVQRVNHAIFRPEVHEDIAAVTAHLDARGCVTPRLVPTDDGRLCHVTSTGEIWRVMGYLPGVTVHRVESPARARAAGALVARFHAAVDSLSWDYRHVRPGAHDTLAHMAALDAARSAPRTGSAAEVDAADAVAAAILSDWSTWDGRLDLPLRHAHGDLKISNLRFRQDGSGLCLLDLDTLGRFSLDVELGDAFRSWCNPVGEDGTDTRFDLGIFAAAVAGYASERSFDAAERASLVPGVERICLELAARFCRDVYEDRYFGWNAERFPSRAAHNLHRARGQLSLARSVRAQRAEAARVLREAAG
jgi:Ser/Thr protein kinase RdoA (MazF antagonist)